jgi:hypothetical protein
MLLARYWREHHLELCVCCVVQAVPACAAVHWHHHQEAAAALPADERDLLQQGAGLRREAPGEATADTNCYDCCYLAHTCGYLAFVYACCLRSATTRCRTAQKSTRLCDSRQKPPVAFIVLCPVDALYRCKCLQGHHLQSKSHMLLLASSWLRRLLLRPGADLCAQPQGDLTAVLPTFMRCIPVICLPT